MQLHRLVSAFLLAGGLAANGAARADILFDSLSNSDDGYSVNATIAGDYAVGSSFSTGSGGVSLTDVKLVVSNPCATGGPLAPCAANNGEFKLYLALDPVTAATDHIATLATLDDANFGIAAVVFDVPVADISLASGTRYWIVLAGSSGLSWDYSGCGPCSGVNIDSEFWYNTGDDPTQVFSNIGGPNLMQVSAVPEPAALTLLGAGLAGFVAARRRRA